MKIQNSFVLFRVLVALTAFWSVSAAGAEEFASGPGALEIFDDEGFAATSLAVKLWLAFLVSTFAAGLFFVWTRPLARWVVGGLLLSLSTGHIVFAALGLPMLGGSIALWHIVCWTPGLLLLLVKHPFTDPNEDRPYRIWSLVITTVILVSFVFDIRDAAIYIAHFGGLGG